MKSLVKVGTKNRLHSFSWCLLALNRKTLQKAMHQDILEATSNPSIKDILYPTPSVTDRSSRLI